MKNEDVLVRDGKMVRERFGRWRGSGEGESCRRWRDSDGGERRM